MFSQAFGLQKLNWVGDYLKIAMVLDDVLILQSTENRVIYIQDRYTEKIHPSSISIDD